MEDLKVRVNNETESKEVQELFLALGLKCRNWADLPYPKLIANYIEGRFTDCYIDDCKVINEYKEITIQQLRDLVVLKRNCVDDATHENAMYPYIKLSDGWYYFDDDVEKWMKSTGGKPEYYEKLKPIEKEMKMKEYLDKDYVLRSVKQTTGDNRVPDGWIEVPKGAEIAIFYPEDNDLIFYTENFEFMYVNGRDGGFSNSNWCGQDFGRLEYLLAGGNQVVWQRAETENTGAEQSTRKHSHYFKDVSQLDVIDVYDVLKLFEVTDPCLQHIIKKALCAGKRGHKDLQTDLQNIVDTAFRAVELNK